MTFHLLLRSTVNYAMNQQRLMTSLFQQSSRMAYLQLVHGNAESVRQSMDDKEQLLTVLVLALFIGGIVMGLMLHG